MPYTVNKSGSGYKVYKKGTKKAFSKKPHKTKKEAIQQQKALYASEANESLVIENKIEDTLVYKNLFKYSKTNQFHVHFELESKKNVLFVLVYSSGKTVNEVDYIETQVTDGNIPSIEFFEDPQSEEAKSILNRYGLTSDQIENAGQEGYEKIAKHYPEEDVIESLEFESYFNSIVS